MRVNHIENNDVHDIWYDTESHFFWIVNRCFCDDYHFHRRIFRSGGILASIKLSDHACSTSDSM